MHTNLSPKQLSQLLDRVGQSYLPKALTKQKLTKQQIFIISNKKKSNKKRY